MTLNNVKDKIEQYIQKIDSDIAVDIISKIKIGKMLRSKLILAISPNNQKAIELCAIAELIHLASLLHDDVIDQSDTRRGEPSINNIYGDKTAIMLGDILYSLAFSKLANFDKQIINSIASSVSTLSLGEFLDVQLSQHFNEDTSLYMDMLYKKTSALIEAVSFSSAILANKNAKAFKDYGKYLGICFQLIDDLLDITQSDEVLGKPAMSDYKEGKVTIPYILLFNALSHEDKTKLKNMHKKELNESQKIWLKNSFKKHNIKEKTLKYINTFYIKAKQALPQDDDKLQDVLDQAINRKF